ncbi:MAG: hypothetical protein IKX96_00020 [Firmicutes bacterium]|nr:hypothetical protein [Bacillota bacterium]
MADNLHFEKGIKYEIFIGIKDKDSYEELLNVEDFINIMSGICTEREMSFSLLTQLGGYTHGKGYTTETSMRVIIIGVSEQEIVALGECLKKKVNTDTILITRTEVEYCFT